MRYIVTLILYIICTLVCFSQGITGKIVDEHGDAIQYANVILLQSPDSTFIEGVVCDTDGYFSLKKSYKDGIVKVSCVGYITNYQHVSDSNLGVIVLKEENMTLNGVMVKSSLPKSRLKHGAVVTTVAGSILEKTGSMENLLDRIPNVTSQKGKIEVFGHGAPVVYINGKMVRSNAELSRLNPEDINTIEVIENPGVQYASNVNAVIRINTKKLSKQGLGLETRTFGELEENANFGGYEQININYQKKGLEAFSFFRLKESNKSNKQGLIQNTYTDNAWHQYNNIESSQENKQLYSGLGANYKVDNNNTFGASINFNRNINNGKREMDTSIDNGIVFIEKSVSSIASYGNSSLINSNIYYIGKFGNIDINFNMDWLWNKKSSKMNTVEKCQEYDNDWFSNIVHSNTITRNCLFASKLMLSLPLWKGKFSFGGEFSETNRKSSYNVEPAEILERQNNRIEERMASFFFDYNRKIGKLSILAGIRYENTDFDYFKGEKQIGEQSKTYGNFLPSLSCTFPVGNTQMQLSYRANIKRPSYYNMRAGIEYVNRYTYQSGNPFLVSETNRNINYTVSYKWFVAGFVYTHVSDPIIMLSQSYKNKPNIALIHAVNCDSYNRIGTSVSVSPKLGIWHPSLRLYFFKQWFNMETHGGHRLNHPKMTVRFDNTLDTKLCSVSLMFTAQTKGDDETSYMYRNYFSANLSMYKSFLKGRIMLFLSATDLLGTGNMYSHMYSGSMRDIVHHDFSTSNYSLTFRYRINVAKSKYKGTGAGQEQKNRM